MLAIINAELVMRDHLIPEAVLFVEDGKIAGFGEMRSTPIPEGCEIIDAQGLYVGPGSLTPFRRIMSLCLPQARTSSACGVWPPSGVLQG